MKKTIIILTIIVLTLCNNKKNTIKIPNESIRFRVIANSNDEIDQEIKKELTKNVIKELKNINYVSNLDENKKMIKNSLPKLERVLNSSNIIKNEEIKYKIEFGKNYFPKKEYKGVIYEEGEYDSLVITLGKGTGDNFWCVLFPPLCLLEGESTNTKNVEYTSYIKEIINKYF